MLEAFIAVWPQLVTILSSIAGGIAFLNRKLHKIDKIDKKLTKHIRNDIRYKIKDEWRELKRMERRGEAMNILTLKEAVDLVAQAEHYKVNGETTQMQRDIKRWYNEELQLQYGKDDVQ